METEMQNGFGQVNEGGRERVTRRLSLYTDNLRARNEQNAESTT